MISKSEIDAYCAAKALVKRLDSKIRAAIAGGNTITGELYTVTREKESQRLYLPMERLLRPTKTAASVLELIGVDTAIGLWSRLPVSKPTKEKIYKDLTTSATSVLNGAIQRKTHAGSMKISLI